MLIVCVSRAGNGGERRRGANGAARRAWRGGKCLTKKSHHRFFYG